MCLRPPCPNCGDDYDACYPACPKCGHPDGGVGFLSPFGSVIARVRMVPCKVCKIDHPVFDFLSLKPGDVSRPCCYCGALLTMHACTGEEKDAVACKKLKSCDLHKCTGYDSGSTSSS